MASFIRLLTTVLVALTVLAGLTASAGAQSPPKMSVDEGLKLFGGVGGYLRWLEARAMQDRVLAEGADAWAEIQSTARVGGVLESEPHT